MTEFGLSGFDVVAFVLVGLLIFGLFRGLRVLISRRLGLTRERRATIQRAMPAVEALAYLVYALSALPLVLDDHPEVTAIALSAVFATIIAVSWFALRDFTAGVFVKSGQLCTVGDYVRFGAIEGRVIRLDLRTLAIETRTGDEAIIPYSQLSGQSLVRTPIPDGAFRHAFAVAAPPGLAASAAEETIRRHALCSHWSSIAREPQVERTPDGALQVTVFALSPQRGPDIEAAVRAALGARQEQA